LFDLIRGLCIADPRVTDQQIQVERLGLPSDDQKTNHDEPTLPSLRYIPLFDGN